MSVATIVNQEVRSGQSNGLTLLLGQCQAPKFSQQRHIVVAMPTERRSARNGAAADYLRGLKKIGVTNKDIADGSNIPFDTVNKLMTNRSDFTMDQFLAIAQYLGVDDATALRTLSEIVRD